MFITEKFYNKVFQVKCLYFIRLVWKNTRIKNLEERKKTNNNRKITWKAIVAVVLVMASLFAMSSLVNAGIVELILGEEYAEVAAAASEESSGSSEGEDEANECKHEKINSVDSKLRSPCPVCNEDRVVWHLICANENCKKSLGTTIDFHWQH